MVETPPGFSMPPIDGFTSFWEDELGLLYATDRDAELVDLSVGQRVRFELRRVVLSGWDVFWIAFNIVTV